MSSSGSAMAPKASGRSTGAAGGGHEHGRRGDAGEVDVGGGSRGWRRSRSCAPGSGSSAARWSRTQAASGATRRSMARTSPSEAATIISTAERRAAEPVGDAGPEPVADPARRCRGGEAEEAEDREHGDQSSRARP